MALHIKPINLRDANTFVSKHHRHHQPVRGCKFCVAVADDDDVVRGVAIVGRPVARMLDDGQTLEVNRVATDGARNACSMLYRAAWRAAVALGYQRVITYTLPEEGGASLRGAGMEYVGPAGGGQWSRPSRQRAVTARPEPKSLWQLTAQGRVEPAGG